MKLTKRSVDALKAKPADQVIFDEDLPGFGIRVKPNGTKSWLIQYRNKHGRSRRLSLGLITKITPAQARKRAKAHFVDVADGKDPAATRGADRQAMTVAQLCDEYLKAGHNRIKASTLAMDRSRIAAHVKPLLGSRTVAGLTGADIEKFVRDVENGRTAARVGEKRAKGGVARGGAGVAARTVGMLSTILQLAVKREFIASNPARGVPKPKTSARKPLFSFDAVKSLGKALHEAEEEQDNQIGLDAIRFLLLSGCRRMEALTLRWGTVDERDQCLRFEDTKSGAQIRPLGKGALALLASIHPAHRKPDTYVFPGSLKGSHLVGLPRVWARICKRANISDVSIHGLRHWFASAAAAMGFSELVIAGLLGHRVKGVTARYATAPDSALVAAADQVSLALAKALTG